MTRAFQDLSTSNPSEERGPGETWHNNKLPSVILVTKVERLRVRNGSHNELDSDNYVILFSTVNKMGRGKDTKTT